MVVVAVAGGTGGVGKTIVEQLQISKKHEVILISRKVNATHSRSHMHTRLNPF